ncbi:MAG TPA: GntR family transcriptional regulator [Candidatus Acetothermia bacterium]|nr:GntR family transcriptional regulator [Candidatus Acetothermia bacterium]
MPTLRSLAFYLRKLNAQHPPVNKYNLTIVLVRGINNRLTMIDNNELMASKQVDGEDYANLQHVHAPLLSRIAYKAICAGISAGQVKPGEWLRQDALAQKLGVSQATVREALNRLVSDGLALHVPHKGVKAVTISVEDLRDIYDMRALLEGLANKLAASQISQQGLVRMRELLPDTVVGVDAQSTDIARAANRQFHWVAIRASGRSHLIRVLEQLWTLIDPYMVYGRFWNVEQTHQERIEGSVLDLEDHTRLMDSLERRDGHLAQQITQEYVHRSFRELEQQIRAIEKT